MNKIISITQIRELISQIRNLGKGFLTNFYLDEDKHHIWIENDIFYYEIIGSTCFFIKRNVDFINLFYLTTSLTELKLSLNIFSKSIQQELIIDIVGKENQCNKISSNLEELGFMTYKSLIRMSRLTPPYLEVINDPHLEYLDVNDLPLIKDILDCYFDAKSEQIPLIEELEKYSRNKQIIIYKKDYKIAGFLIFENNATTLYLRYWFVDPKYRDQKIGAKLLNAFFNIGRETKRQLFWVITDNVNAIKRYSHYGFKNEDMFDYILKRK